jgi:hypothetical protein
MILSTAKSKLNLIVTNLIIYLIQKDHTLDINLTLNKRKKNENELKLTIFQDKHEIENLEISSPKN